ncbi:MAG: VWA domain-containing protein [Chloroflexi bacterium]|nr:VWA domain-containing protein [Chloroflexota bacterium]
MNRTQITFAAIIGVTVLIVCAAVGFSLISNQLGDSTAEATPVGGFEVPENVSEDAVVVTVASSNTKEGWLNAVVEKFNASGQTTADGRPIVVSVSHVTSGASMEAILAGNLQPVAWSPGDPSWADQLNSQWRTQTNSNQDLNSAACTPTIYAPLGFAMWRPMAEALGWPDAPISWEMLVDLANDPDGWNSIPSASPQWGEFRFGHTHPAYANSGLLSMTSFVYGVVDTGGQAITPAQVYEAEADMRALQNVTAKYGLQAPALLDLMARQGPSYLHAAAVPEADVVRFNIERGSELALGGLVFIFPSGGTIWADHPYCILDRAEWVTAEQAEGGQIFLDYLLAREQQELAIDNYLRPLDSNVALRAPLTLENGTIPTASPATIPALPSPDEAVSEAVIDLFLLTKRKATIVLVLDTSGSMRGERISTATTATVDFLDNLSPDDEVAVLTFSNNTLTLSEPNRVGEVKESLQPLIRTLIAEGNTALYESVCQATALMADLQAEDVAAGESRLYGIVLLSDGEDTIGRPTEGQMFATCLPTNAEADGVKIFPIAFGGEADTAVLQRIANVTGGRLFTADPASIGRVYNSIAAEQ